MISKCRFVGAFMFAATVWCGSSASGEVGSNPDLVPVIGDGMIVASSGAAGTCPEDINQDGRVDFADLLDVFANWGILGGPADVDGNGVVDAGDILLILIAWGVCP